MSLRQLYCIKTEGWQHRSAISLNSIIICRQQKAVTFPKEKNSVIQIFYPSWITIYSTSISTGRVGYTPKSDNQSVENDQHVTHKESYQIIFMKNISSRRINGNALLSIWASTAWSKIGRIYVNFFIVKPLSNQNKCPPH